VRISIYCINGRQFGSWDDDQHEGLKNEAPWRQKSRRLGYRVSWAMGRIGMSGGEDAEALSFSACFISTSRKLICSKCTFKIHYTSMARALYMVGLTSEHGTHLCRAPGWKGAPNDMRPKFWAPFLCYLPPTQLTEILIVRCTNFEPKFHQNPFSVGAPPRIQRRGELTTVPRTPSRLGRGGDTPSLPSSPSTPSMSRSLRCRRPAPRCLWRLASMQWFPGVVDCRVYIGPTRCLIWPWLSEFY